MSCPGPEGGQGPAADGWPRSGPQSLASRTWWVSTPSLRDSLLAEAKRPHMSDALAAEYNEAVEGALLCRGEGRRVAGLVDLRQMTAADVRTLIVLGLQRNWRRETESSPLRLHSDRMRSASCALAAEVPAVCGRGAEGRRTMGSTTRRRCMIGRCSCLPTGCRSHNGDRGTSADG